MCACVCEGKKRAVCTAQELSSLVSLQRLVFGCKRSCQSVSVTTCHFGPSFTHNRVHTHTLPEDIVSRFELVSTGEFTPSHTPNLSPPATRGIDARL